MASGVGMIQGAGVGRIQRGLHHKENVAANKQKIKAKLKEIPLSDSCITYKIF